ncbi:catechol 1,2-dioxygenase [Ornithinimicrobium sp. F0845]|uniref:dioxygenase family protein n=1 Tax=Ornithinimicrobium sp. F0845 TaxID=2926412 RepID=UPI001FF30FA1|nr:dioxygenase [Ornithinimicrobium sp. F0845]MCK0113611.1 catechol 1,2-dioxygenase [Ornithinimicrobium sp. F0845]
MTTIDTARPTNLRLQEVFDDVLQALLDAITRHRVTWEEFRVATEWLTEAGDQGIEIPLMLDVFLSSTVDDLAHAGDGTENNLEGPYYVPDAPFLHHPYVLPQRQDEPGEKLHFAGRVRSTDGTPLAGAVLDVWQSNGLGEYSHVQPDLPEFNLRGRLVADQDGCFEFMTVVPVPYAIPTDGATGRLLAAMGREPFRPAHIHFRISHPDCEPLTTQIYFEDDPWLDADVAGAVKESLVTPVTRWADAGGGQYAGCAYDFVLSGSATAPSALRAG